MVRFLGVSDLHVEIGEEEERAKWLNDLISRYDVDFVLSAGDNGLIGCDFIEMLDAEFYTVYGNHDAPSLVKEGHCHNKCWLADGLHMIEGVSVLAWNGIFGFRRGKDRKWYYRSLDDAVRFGFGYANKRPDVFVSHEVPFYRFGEGKVTQEYLCVMNFIVKRVKPKVWLNGHMHMHKPFTFDGVMFAPTVYIRVQGLKDNWSVVVFEKEGEGIRIVDILAKGHKSLYSFRT